MKYTNQKQRLLIYFTCETVFISFIYSCVMKFLFWFSDNSSSHLNETENAFSQIFFLRLFRKPRRCSKVSIKKRFILTGIRPTIPYFKRSICQSSVIAPYGTQPLTFMRIMKSGTMGLSWDWTLKLFRHRYSCLA